MIYRICILFCALSFCAPTVGAEPLVCEEPGINVELNYLKRLSLDLRGHTPSVAELEQVIANGEVAPDVIEAMLYSDGFKHQMRSYHRELLWANLNQRIANNTWQIQGPRRQPNGPYSSISFGRRTQYRGGQIGCRDEPAEFDAEGNIITVEEESPPNSGQFVRREGYVEVEPYWAPGTTLKVCAFDAQTNETGTNNQGRPVNCSRGVGPECGCGPNLRHCVTREVQNEIVSYMTEQMLRMADEIVDADQPYSNIITGQNYQVNGPIVHYYRYLTNAGPNFVAASEDPGHTLPDISFGDKNWVDVEVTSPLHSGVLTLPGFLLKFQSNRGRANRFYNAFLCQAFQAPEGGLPAADDVCNDEPDLTQRCGCAYCHATVEPAAAHWGRWSEAGLAPMNNRDFPRYKEQCDPTTNARAANNFMCRRFYMVDPVHEKEVAYAGHLNAYIFSNEHDERQSSIEEGPKLLADTAIRTGEFAKCTTEKMWNLFIGRWSRTSETALLAGLSMDFAESMTLRTLIHSIVTQAEYRYAGLFGQEQQQ